MKPVDIKDALGPEYKKAIIVAENEEWELPAGAYGESCGPT